MATQTLSAGTVNVAVRPRTLGLYRGVLWAALLTYPLVPAALYQSRGLAESRPWFGVACLVASYLWAVSGPLAGWLMLCETDRLKLRRRDHPQLAREAILAWIAAPFYVLSGAVLAWGRLTAYQDALWYALLAGVAAARFLPAPETPTTTGYVLGRLHRASALLLLAFAAAHVFNHLAAVDSLAAHVSVQNVLRTVYRQPVIEVLIVIAALSQVWTGWKLVSRARQQRTTAMGNLQILAGSYLGMFFLSHLTGVFISGRLIQHVDTTFAWATGGPHGLLTNPRSPEFIPYYSLAVLVVFVHAAAAARWTLVPVLGAPGAQRASYAVVVLGIVVTALLLLPMAGIHLA